MQLPTYIYGRNIQLQLFKRKLDARDVADKLCITHETFWRIRNGRNRQIDPHIFYQLKDLLSCTANDLLEVHPDVNYSTIQPPTPQ